jgi:predicted transcriptional regulator with HTH domain
MKQLSEKMLGILERLAEMFPKQNYQSELDRYVSSKYPTSVADVEHWTREFDKQQSTYSWRATQ